MPLIKYGANFQYVREELLALFTHAQTEAVEHGGRYEARGSVAACLVASMEHAGPAR